MSSENNKSKSIELHDDSLWAKTDFVTTKVGEDTLTVTKKEGSSKQELYYPKNIRLSGDFEIEMEIKSENGKYITFMLNNKLTYGGNVFGWRNISEWTDLRIVRKDGKLEVYYDKSRHPQVLRDSTMEELYFCIRFNGWEDENSLEYRNLRIINNGKIIFKDYYINYELETINKKINLLSDKIEDIDVNTNNYINFSLLNTDIRTSGALYYSQSFCNELLDFVVGICEKHDLEYWLDFGTLLGAVRHGGFIPWDDDVDLGMMREDFNKLLEVLDDEFEQTGLEKHFFKKIDVPVGTGNWARTFLQVLYMDDNRKTLSWVDVFAYDYIKDFDEDISARYYNERKEFNQKIINGVERSIAEKETYKNLNLTYHKQEHIIHGVDGAQGASNKDMKFDIFETSLFHPLTTRKFNNKEYNVPHDYDNYLRRLYGDYLKPVVNQKHGQKEDLMKREDMDVYCTSYLEKLKKINNHQEVKISEDYETRLGKMESLVSDLLIQYDKKDEKIEKLNEELLSAKEDLNSYITSYNEQFKTIYMYHDLKDKGVLKYSRELDQELLDWVVKVCKKHGLNYWLDYGTLLGAVRHGGFIPWDDDIDLGMMREDFNIFAKVMDEEIKENNLDDIVNLNLDRTGSNDSIIPFIQIFITPDYNRFYAGLDVFPYDYIADKDTCNSKKFLKEKVSYLRKMNKNKDRTKYIGEYYDKFNLTYEKQNFIIPGIDNARGGYSGYKYDVLSSDDLYPLKTIKFNDIEYDCPANTDVWLRSIYGEYYEFPKIIHHHHHRLDFLNKQEDTTEIYDEYLEKLKKVNENYD